MGSSTRPREQCSDSGAKEESNKDRTIMGFHPSSASRNHKRQTRHFTCRVFLISLWFFILGSSILLNDQTVNAQGPILPSTLSSSSSSSSSLSSSFVSKARIVIPSGCQDEDEIDSDHFEMRPEALGRESFIDDMHNPVAFVSRGEPRPRNIHQNLSPDIETVVDEQVDMPGRIPPPSKKAFKKTGTTIAGCVIQGDSGPYVVLAADTRATENTLVADKRCDKIHKLASNCRCCGAGTSADLDKTTRQVLYQMALLELQNQNIGNNHGSQDDHKELLYSEHGDDEPLLWMRPVSIDILCGIFQDMLFKNGGQLGANLIVGGVWNNKAYLRAIHPHGSTDVDLPFAALGSGGLAAMAVLEEGYRPSLTIEEGVDLVQRAILSGIRNDLGSGSQVDLCVIDPDGKCHQTRAAIPEEELLPDGNSTTAGEEDSSNRSNGLADILGPVESKGKEDTSSRSDTNTNSGVNGFGNQPFAIENTKQRMVSVEMDRTEQKETWDRVLGLKN